METKVLEWLFTQSPLLALMGLGLYIFYKKDEQRRNNDLIERVALLKKLEDQEQRIEKYYKNDGLILQNIVKESTEASIKLAETTEKQTAMMVRTNETMLCIIKEIQEFKRSEIYKYHERNKTGPDGQK